MDPFFSQLYQQLQREQQQHQEQQKQLYLQQNPTTTPTPMQGPRPAPLRVSKESHKINKPPPGRPPAGAGHRPPLPPAQRQPVIIYAVSPKVVYTQPSQFMSVVQRLTGLNSSACANPISSAGFPSPCGPMSPAARLATIERAQQTIDHTGKPRLLVDDFDIIERYDAGGASTVAQSSFLGILSPNPSSLPGISPNLFSPGITELNSLGFLDMIGSFSPVVPVNKNFVDNSFLHSPTFPFTPTVPSPSWDLFAASFSDF